MKHMTFAIIIGVLAVTMLPGKASALPAAGEFAVYDASGTCISGPAGFDGCPGYVWPHANPWWALAAGPVTDGRVEFGEGTFVLEKNTGSGDFIKMGNTGSILVKGAGKGVTRLVGGPGQELDTSSDTNSPFVMKDLTFENAWINIDFRAGVEFDNVEFTGGAGEDATIKMKNVDYADGVVTINNCHFHDIESSAIETTWGVGEINITNTVIERAPDTYMPNVGGEGQNAAIRVRGYCFLTVLDSTIKDSASYGIFGSIFPDGGGGSIALDRCTIDNCNAVFSGGAALYSPNTTGTDWDLNRVTVKNSYFGTDSGNGARHSGAVGGASGDSHMDVTNSLFTGNAEALVAYNHGNTNILNNTFDDNTITDIDARDYDDSGDVLANNIGDSIAYSAGLDGAVFGPNLTLAEAAPLDANYVPQIGSAAINAGILAALSDPLDFDGDPRAVCAAVDIGAQESPAANSPCPGIDSVLDSLCTAFTSSQPTSNAEFCDEVATLIDAAVDGGGCDPDDCVAQVVTALADAGVTCP